MTREDDLFRRGDIVISDAMKIRFFPFVMETQEGTVITGVEDDKLIDFTASWAVANAGYYHPHVVDSIQEQLGQALANSPISIPHEPVIELAERLRDLASFDFQTKVWFGHSGSEAGDLLSKAIPATGDGNTVVTFEGSYHGITRGAATISGHSAQEGVSAENVRSVPFPNCFRSKLAGPELAEQSLESVKEAFETTNVAGLITEPLQSDEGIQVPPDGFLEGLSDLCIDHNAYFVVDEVKTGLGRTGELFAFQHADVEPDAIMLGKPLGSGIPISAVVGQAELVDFEPASHMMTTAGGPLPAIAGLATLDVVESEDLSERATRLGSRLRERLASIGESPVVGDVRGRGLMQGVELVNEAGSDPDAELAARTCLWARRHGLVVFYVGMDSNVLELTPPLTLNEEELDAGCDRLAAAIEDARSKPLDDDLLERCAGW